MKFSQAVIVAVASSFTAYSGSAFVPSKASHHHGQTTASFIEKKSADSSSLLQAMSANHNFFGFGYHNPRGTIQFPDYVDEPEPVYSKPIQVATPLSMALTKNNQATKILEAATATVTKKEKVLVAVGDGNGPKPVYRQPVQAVTATTRYEEVIVAPEAAITHENSMENNQALGDVDDSEPLPVTETLKLAPSVEAEPATVVPEKAATPTITKDEVRALFNLWNDALSTGDSRLVASRYSEDPTLLLTTVSDTTPRTDSQSVKEYFDNFLLQKPKAKILEGYIKIMGDTMCSDSGIYEFTMGANGSKVKANYSFVYVYENDKWKISHHHSSVIPEASNDGDKIITQDEVRGLFHLWNKALACGDSKEVALRYSRNAVLIPPMSDQPRADFHSIREYFDNFLEGKPQGRIIQSNVIIGTNWCQDTGIYELSMGANGKKVKARYTFLYVYENNEWKIAHHHSSLLPEAPKGEKITKDDVRNLFYRWNEALASGDASEVAHRYARDSIILPTSDTPKKDYYEIKDYYANLLQFQPRAQIIESNVYIGDNFAQDVGVYEMSMNDGSVVRARYTFNYVFEKGDWKISHHHSSAMP